MAVNGNGQFQYPTQDWAAGKMRMAGNGGQPTLSSEEWGKFWQGNWNVVGESGAVDPSKADQGGFVIKKGHPQIKELEKNGWESHDIPDAGWGKDFQFMKPPQKGVPVAAMLPTQGQAQSIVEQVGRRSKGKREEAVAK